MSFEFLSMCIYIWSGSTCYDWVNIFIIVIGSIAHVQWLKDYLSDCRKQSEVMMNVEGGYILRSKSATTNEVGLNAGFGALDLPTLVS